MNENIWTVKFFDCELIMKDGLIDSFIDHYDSIKYRKRVSRLLTANNHITIIYSHKDFKTKKIKSSILKNKKHVQSHQK